MRYALRRGPVLLVAAIALAAPACASQGSETARPVFAPRGGVLPPAQQKIEDGEKGTTTTTRQPTFRRAIESIPYPEFLEALRRGEVQRAVIGQGAGVFEVRYTDAVSGKPKRTTEIRTEESLNELRAKLRESGIPYMFAEMRFGGSGFPSFLLVPLIFLFPLLLFFVAWWFFFRSRKGAPGGVGAGHSGFTRTPSLRRKGSSSSATNKDGAKEPATPKVTFADIAGIDEAVEEVREVRDFLMNPERFTALGAKIPRGVLLYGHPGCGKTLLAKAVAGESGANFFSVSGSEFVELYVGTGASRVRDLFANAKTNAPAIVFIDEIDAVGRKRGAHMQGGNDERDQTLNQLLVEMDGFEGNAGIVVMAATNRPDILDPALLRPGRFDRHIVVDRPDADGRRAILRIHAKGKPIREEDLEALVKPTSGFSGADLANLLNEAAIFAARRDKNEISFKELDAAFTRVIAGAERRTRRLSEMEKRITAYHEAGHALVGYVMPGADSVQKVTIIPRGQSLGHTLSLPSEERFLTRKSELLAKLAVLYGGRAAEEVIFTDPTTGASGDIEQATQIARQMVVSFGMSALGPVKFSGAEHESFFARLHSEYVAAAIDEEVRSFIREAENTARAIIVAHRGALERMVVALLEKETIDTPEEIAEVLGDLPKWRPPSAAGTGRERDPASPETPSLEADMKEREEESEKQSALDSVIGFVETVGRKLEVFRRQRRNGGEER